MKAMLGRKIGMSQIFSPEGEAIPVTLIEATDNVVTLRRQSDKDGHEAIQLGLPRKHQKARYKSQKDGAVSPRQLVGLYSARHEFAIAVSEEEQTVTVAQFQPGDIVEISGISKGKGFQGVVKRHHFKGGPASHGHRHVLRRPGSIGSRFPQHTLKGMRMAGRMGSDRVTVKNLIIVHVDNEKKLLAIKGAVPGKRGTVLEIRTTE